MHLSSTRFTKLSLYWQLSAVFLLGLVLFSSAAHAQNNSERNNTSYGSEYTNNYYVDEAGLQLAVNATPLDNFIDPTTYELGPYDVISLQGIGLTEFSYRAVLVNALGDIVTPIAGKVNLKGLTLSEAEAKVKTHFFLLCFRHRSLLNPRPTKTRKHTCGWNIYARSLCGSSRHTLRCSYLRL